jgi:dipeptidyl aminopeptidase/acylaminoacyl peptidase
MRAASLLLLYLIFTIPAFPQVAEGPARTFSAQDLFGLRVAADPQVRPDGNTIAYVRETFDIANDNSQPSIWLIDPATAIQSPLVVDENANFAPRWSPDGQRLAYVVSAPGRPPQLYVRWIASGRSARVANLEQAPNSNRMVTRREDSCIRNVDAR